LRGDKWKRHSWKEEKATWGYENVKKTTAGMGRSIGLREEPRSTKLVAKKTSEEKGRKIKGEPVRKVKKRKIVRERTMKKD